MRTVLGLFVLSAGFAAIMACSAAQIAAVLPVDENTLREYTGVYQWEGGGFVYLQLWAEFTGSKQLVAFDESGETRTLFPTSSDRFFTGAGAAVRDAVESRIEFQRDATGKVAAMTWRREGATARVARRAAMMRREDVRFASGDIQLTGTLISPRAGGKHPAVILVHASGAEDREYLLPFAWFLVRRGIAVLGYDKRGVGGSSGDWSIASFDDLAGDVVAAFTYLTKRSDIDSRHIGLLGWSQAGWIMPLAAIRAKEIAFLISVSGPGVPAAETTIDQARNEMTARGMRPQMIEQIAALMKLQYDYARTGERWEQYAAAREKIAVRLGGPPPDNFPGTREHPYWQMVRRLYFYDPAPTLRQLQLPTLAIFGELDNNVLAKKNASAWEVALQAGGNRDYTVRILPRANHMMLEAKVGSNAEMPSLRRFVPEYVATVEKWLAARVDAVDAARGAHGRGPREKR